MTVQAAKHPARAPCAPRVSSVSLGNLIGRPEAGALIGTLGVFIFFAIFGGAEFLATGGTASWLNVAAELGIIAIPVGLLMIAGELDLSVGSVLAASSMTLAIVSGHWGGPMILGILLALGLGLADRDSSTGLIVTRTNVPSFVVTLATLFGARRADPRPVPRHHRDHQRRPSTPDPASKDALRHAHRRPVRGGHLLVDRRRRRASAGCCT